MRGRVGWWNGITPTQHHKIIRNMNNEWSTKKKTYSYEPPFCEIPILMMLGSVSEHWKFSSFCYRFDFCFCFSVWFRLLKRNWVFHSDTLHGFCSVLFCFCSFRITLLHRSHRHHHQPIILLCGFDDVFFSSFSWCWKNRIALRKTLTMTTQKLYFPLNFPSTNASTIQ